MEKDSGVAMKKRAYVYLMASERNGTLYLGVTSDLARRVTEHRQGTVKGFTSRYSVKVLVYCEVHEDMTTAIAREKAMKKWNRAWKIEAIEKANPDWNDLSNDILQ